MYTRSNIIKNIYFYTFVDISSKLSSNVFFPSVLLSGKIQLLDENTDFSISVHNTLNNAVYNFHQITPHRISCFLRSRRTSEYVTFCNNNALTRLSSLVATVIRLAALLQISISWRSSVNQT